MLLERRREDNPAADRVVATPAGKRHLLRLVTRNKSLQGILVQCVRG